jgi:hypothetical protein
MGPCLPSRNQSASLRVMRHRPGPDVLIGVLAVLALLGLPALVVLSGTALGLMFEGQPRSYPPTPAEAALLGSDVHLMIGGVALTLPLIALDRDSRRDAFFSDNGPDWIAAEAVQRAGFAAEAGLAAAPLRRDRASVRIEAFGLEDSDGIAWRRVCDHLVRRWSRSVCDNAFAPLLQALPRGSFDLADSRRLDAFRNTFLSIGDLGEAAPILQAMDLRLGEPSLACGTPYKPDAPRPCLVALQVKGDLVAVWFVRDGPDDSALTQARREGRAITAFVAHGLGPVEDFSNLTAAACATLRPGAKPLRSNDPDWPC